MTAAVRHTYANSGASIIATNVKAHYDATVSGSVLNGSATQCTDGQNVQTWKDQSGNGFDLTETAPAPAAFYNSTTANMINGHPSVYFGQVAGYFSTGAFSLSQPFTVYCVIRDNAGGSGGYVWTSSTSSPLCRFICIADYEVYANSATMSGGTTDTTAHTTVQVLNGASSLIRVDGSQVASGNPGSAAIGSSLVIGNVWLGGASNPWKGPMGELIFYSVAHNTTQMQQNEAALKAKWGTP